MPLGRVIARDSTNPAAHNWLQYAARMTWHDAQDNLAQAAVTLAQLCSPSQRTNARSKSKLCPAQCCLRWTVLGIAMGKSVQGKFAGHSRDGESGVLPNKE